MKQRVLVSTPIHRLLLSAVLLAGIFGAGCSRRREEGSPESTRSAAPSGAMAADSTEAPKEAPSGYISSIAARVSGDSTHKFLRTGDLKFRVSDVVRATYQIEDITSKFGGYVSYTKLESSIDRSETFPVTTDSAFEVTYFTVSNTMTLRIPDVKLDSTLKAIASHVEFMDYRVLSAEDVALQLLSNELTQRRAQMAVHEVTTSVDESARKHTKATTEVHAPQEAAESADMARIENLQLMDQVKFSTVKLNIYQLPSARRTVVANLKDIDTYRPDLGVRLLDALGAGWRILGDIVIGIIHLWGVILFIFAIWFIYRTFLRKPKPVVQPASPPPSEGPTKQP